MVEGEHVGGSLLPVPVVWASVSTGMSVEGALLLLHGGPFWLFNFPWKPLWASPVLSLPTRATGRDRAWSRRLRGCAGQA